VDLLLRLWLMGCVLLVFFVFLIFLMSGLVDEVFWLMRV